MNLVILTALIAVCGAAKLDRTYLPPPSAITAGGSPDSLQTPLTRSSSGQGESSADLPTGSYTNNFQGVVVDAASAGIRATLDGDQSGLGGPRDTYGSTNSKVGDAAFRGSVAGFRNTQTFGSSALNGQGAEINSAQNFGGFESKSERPQAFKDRNSNIISYANDVSSDNYSYGFETDNGIAVGENGVASNGIQAQGGYSYKGDDGQIYKVTYVADEGGYRPQGDHLPTPPPIPKEILESLEQNAKEEAAGLVDDGSYDAQKYNAEGDYTYHNSGNIQYNTPQLSQISKRPESDATASSTFINQNNQGFGKPGHLANTHSTIDGQIGSNFANNQNGPTVSQDKQSSQILSGLQLASAPAGIHSSGHFGQNLGQTQSTFGTQSSQIGSQSNQMPNTHFGTQSFQFGYQANQQASRLSKQPETQSSHTGSQTNQQGLNKPLGGITSQFGVQSNQVESASQIRNQTNKPTLGQAHSSSFNFQSNQVAYLSNQAFKPQGLVGLASQTPNQFAKPQYNDNDHGSTQVSQTQFQQGSNQHLFTGFGSNSLSSIGQSQSNANPSSASFNGNPNPTSFQYGAEYLPPFNLNGKLPDKKTQLNEVSTFQDNQKDDKSPDFVPLNVQNQGFSASASASSGPVASIPQLATSFDNFQSNQNRPNQYNYNSNSMFTSQGLTGSNALPTFSQNNGVQALPQLVSGSKPTAVPEIELTTPLEPNEMPAHSQGSQFYTQPPTSHSNFGFQSINSQIQPQNYFQNNIAGQQQTSSQSLSTPLPDSRPQGSTQFGYSTPSPNSFPITEKPTETDKDKIQSSQNAFDKNQQNISNFSTPKPSFSQGPDDSYYYNQPSNPFNTPAPSTRPQGSRFPSAPSYQSNGVTSFNQQGSLFSPNRFPDSPPLAPEVPVLSGFGQTQGLSATNYINGITQASISAFPSISPTVSAGYDSTNSQQYNAKPISNQPSTSQAQSSRPIITQQDSAVPSFLSKPSNSFGQNLSNSLSQNQISGNSQPSEDQTSPSKPVSSIGQTLSTNSIQNQTNFGQISSINNNKNQYSETTQEDAGATSSTLTQQYQGTVYEYNKPPEVLPAPEQTDSSSSQSVQTDTSSMPEEGHTKESKPQFGSQQIKPQQNVFSSQTIQQASINQTTKPQFGTQSYQPIGSSPTTQTHFGQHTQSTFTQNTFQQNSQGSPYNAKPIKPNESSFLTMNQFGQNPQEVLKPQIGSQPAKPLESASNPSQLRPNIQAPQDISHTSNVPSSHQTQGSVSLQPFKPFSTIQSTLFGQSTQSSFGSQTLQNPGSQFTIQQNKPFGSITTQTTGSISSQHNAQTSQFGAQPFKPFGNQGPQSTKPFGTAETTEVFQGYPSSKPQFGQLTQTAHSSQQTHGTTQISSQPADKTAKPVTNTHSINGSPESHKPQFGQNTQVDQGNRPSETSFGKQPFQNTQFGSQFNKPQYDQNQNPTTIKPFNSASSQAQFDQNPAQASSSAIIQQQPQAPQAYNPFSASAQGSNFQTQGRPQFDQALQSFQEANAQSQFTAQPLKPSSFGASGLLNRPLQNKPFGTQQSVPCCQNSKDSSIVPLNVGKPSQAFAQTQGQFAGFQGAQGFNAQSVAGKGEEFGGPRQPPSFDTQTGYHY